MTISPDNICSIRHFRDHLKEHFDQVEASGDPMLIATHGKPVGVVMSVAQYEALSQDAELARSLRSIDQSLGELEASEGRGMKDAIREIAAKHDIELSKD